MRVVHRSIKAYQSVQDQVLKNLQVERADLMKNAGQEADRLRKLNHERLIAERDMKMRQLEAERARLIQMHDERDRALHEQLRLLDRDEEERRRNRKPLQQQQPIAGNLDFEHFVDGNEQFA